MLTQNNRSKEQFVSIKFQEFVTTLCKEQGGMVLINSRNKCEFVKSCVSGTATDIRTR